MTKRPTESQLQRGLITWLNINGPRCIWFAIPNGGARSAITGAILKAEGVKAGVADLVFIGGKLERVGFIELKRKNGVISPAQKDFDDKCHNYRIPYRVIKSDDLDYIIKEVKSALDAWGCL